MENVDKFIFIFLNAQKKNSKLLKELCELAYQTEKNIDWENAKITVNEAVDLWLKYQAEGDTKKALLLTGLIAIAKAAIRKLYPIE